MSGIIQIGPLEIYEGDRLIGKFDQYEVVDFSDDNLCWSPDGSRVGFYAFKYPDGTFPIFDYELDKLGFQGVVCALDIKKMEIIEMPLEHAPQELKWNGDGSILYMEPQSGEPMHEIQMMEMPPEDPSDMSHEGLRRTAWNEFSIALNNINKSSNANEEPINDPRRLEYYLFDYDPRYVKESAFRYCVKRRNDYLLGKGLPIPFEEDILDDESANHKS